MNKVLSRSALKIFLFSLPIFLGLFFYFSHLLFAATSSTDAIAIRVMQNPKHLSPVAWYAEQKFTGSPQSLLVDGYEAIRDGRTVYVAAANIIDQGSLGVLDKNDQLYTNIYIISFNNDAEQPTQDIFGQILAHWKFNTNLTVPGKCQAQTSTTCTYSPDCTSPDYCKSSKATLLRDVKRLADLNNLNAMLANYRTGHNDLCPTIAAGSYLPNKTISTWPSWQATLGSELGSVLPVDPINQLGDCTQKTDKTGKQYVPPTAGATADTANTTVSYISNTWNYSFDVVKASDYNVYIETSNMGGPNAHYGDLSKFKPAGHEENVCTMGGVQHHIKVSVDGVYKGDMCNEAVPATLTHSVGKVAVGPLTVGNHTVTYAWDNDWTYDPDGVWGTGDEADSNLVIYKVGVESLNFNPTTCWSELDKKFATTTDPIFNLPTNSLAYVYKSSPDGHSCAFYVTTESGLVCDANGVCVVKNNLADPFQFVDPGVMSIGINHAPVVTCGSLTGMPNNSFSGFVSATDLDGDSLTWNIDTSGTTWTGWSTPLKIKSTILPKQKEVYANLSGGQGDYAFKVVVSDSRGSTTIKDCSAHLNNSCGNGVIENGVDAPPYFSKLNYGEECDKAITDPTERCVILNGRGVRDSDGSALDCTTFSNNVIGLGGINLLYQGLCDATTCKFSSTGNPVLDAYIGQGCYVGQTGPTVAAPLASCQKGIWMINGGSLGCTDVFGGTMWDYCCKGHNGDASAKANLTGSTGFSILRADVSDLAVDAFNEVYCTNALAYYISIGNPSGYSWGSFGCTADANYYKFYSCDGICKKVGKVCVGVGLNNPAVSSCISVVHDVGCSAKDAAGNCPDCRKDAVTGECLSCTNAANVVYDDCKNRFSLAGASDSIGYTGIQGYFGTCLADQYTTLNRQYHVGEAACYCK